MRQTLVAAGVLFPNFNTVFVSAVEFVFGLLLNLWRSDAAGLCDVEWRHACVDCDQCNPQYQSIISARLVLRIFISFRGALSRDPVLALSLRPRLV
jgi:hypothetical protein